LVALAVAGGGYFLFSLMTLKHGTPSQDDLDGLWNISKAITHLLLIFFLIYVLWHGIHFAGRLLGL
jgi:hypothetical protein